MKGLAFGGSAFAVVVLLLPLAGCPSDIAPGTTAGPAASTGDLPGITTFGGTVDPTNPVDPDGGSMGGGGSGSSSTSVGGDTTDGSTGLSTTTASTTGSESSSGSDSSSTTNPVTGRGTTTDGPNTTTDTPGTTTTMGPAMTSSSGGGSSSSSSSTGGGSSSSTGMVCHDVFGDYDNCLDANGMTDVSVCNAGIGNATCIVDDLVMPTLGVCSVIDCVDDCDCPDAPPTGNADVVCTAVTGDPAQLFCNLDCSSGQTCPDGMDCFGDLCVWLGPDALGTPYGDCFNNPIDTCGFNGICLNDGGAPTIGVCTQDCVVAADCPPAPPGGAAPVVCSDVTGDMNGECLLDCNGGGACPPGMICFANLICAWN